MRAAARCCSSRAARHGASALGGVKDKAAAAVLLLGAGARLPLLSGLRAIARVHGGLALPRPTIEFVSRPAAYYGSLFLLASLGLELTLL